MGGGGSLGGLWGAGHREQKNDANRGAKFLSVLLGGVARRIAAAIRPAGLLSAIFVRRLLLAFVVPHNALLRPRAVLRRAHACLSAVLAAHVLTAFQIVFLGHLTLRWPGTKIIGTAGPGQAPAVSVAIPSSGAMPTQAKAQHRLQFHLLKID